MKRHVCRAFRPDLDHPDTSYRLLEEVRKGGRFADDLVFYPVRAAQTRQVYRLRCSEDLLEMFR